MPFENHYLFDALRLLCKLGGALLIGEVLPHDFGARTVRRLSAPLFRLTA